MAEMRFVQLDEKNEERMNAIRKFTLMDDTFMTQVFSGDKEHTGAASHHPETKGPDRRKVCNTAYDRQSVWPFCTAGHLCNG